MIEAARIDGSREWNTFNKIILPIMKPAVATQAIFQFIAQWNNLFTPTILLTTDSKENTSYVCTAVKFQSVPYRLWCGLRRIICYHYPAGCGISGSFQIYCCRCGTWWCKGLMEQPGRRKKIFYDEKVKIELAGRVIFRSFSIFIGGKC